MSRVFLNLKPMLQRIKFMKKQYKALHPIGRFKKGDVVGGLDDAQIKKLLADGVIQEVSEPKPAPAKKTTGDEK